MKLLNSGKKDKICLLVIAALSILNTINCDLPSHCLASQIEGQWKLYLGNNHYDSNLSCGHQAPDSNLDHINSHPQQLLKVYSEKIIFLERPNLVYDETKQVLLGKWTMIYDEGFELSIYDQTYMAFVQYEKQIGSAPPTNQDNSDTPGYKSLCHKTYIGWYHRQDNLNWGCFYAEKVNKEIDNLSPSLEANNHSIQEQSLHNVVQPPNSNLRKIHSQQSNITPENDEQSPAITNSNGLEENGPISLDSFIPHQEMYQSTNFMEMESESTVKLFVPDTSYVQKINNDPSSLWKASIHKDFDGKSYNYMKKLLGVSNMKDKQSSSSFIEIKTEVKSEITSGSGSNKLKSRSSTFQSSNFNGLPKNYDWRNVNGENFDSPVRKQGECGSCYAIASLSVMESRIRIQTKNREKPFLSVSSAISCSKYNQGCEGGYPYLIGKYGKEVGFVDDSCDQYREDDSICKKECFMNSKVYKVADYGYVGDHYGGCSVELMMKEIFANGPIVVAINASPELYYYSSGIFTSNVMRLEGKLEKGVGPWQFTNHAVVCVGWGTEMVNNKEEQYWILKNSWGASWGDNGYFKMKKGVNMGSVEAQGEYLTPIL